MATNTKTVAKTVAKTDAKTDGKTVKVVKGYTATQTKQIEHAADLFAVAERGTQAARVAGAKITWSLHTQGKIGSGDGAVETQGKYAERLGVRSNTVTELRRLGNALRVGIKAGSDEWGVLSSKSGGIPELDADTVTLKDVRKILADIASGNRKAGNARGAAAKAAADKKAAQAAKSGKAPVDLTPSQSVDLAIKVLRKHLPHLSREEFSKAETAVSRILASVIKAQVAVDRKNDAAEKLAAAPDAIAS